MLQNTPTGYGNHLPTRIGHFEKIKCSGDLWVLTLISNLGSIILDLGAYLQLLEWLNLGTDLQPPITGMIESWN